MEAKLRRRWSGTGGVFIVLLAFVATARGADPAQSCQAGKNKQVGKYAHCRQNTEAKFATSADAAQRLAGLTKCQEKFDTAWAKLEQKVIDQGGFCPSTGDQAAIRSSVDQFTDDVASALAGGPLSDCGSDLTVCQGDLATCQAALSGTPGLPLKTGQTTCYDAMGAVIPCAGSGQDGELQRGLTRSFTDNGNGTISDNATGLMWEKLSADGGIHDKDALYVWADASTKIAALNAASFAGASDWRLPNVNELQTLVSYGTQAPASYPVFSSACFAPCTVLTCSCTQADLFWTSSTEQYEPTKAWTVVFTIGQVIPFPKEAVGFVRAVRGGA